MFKEFFPSIYYSLQRFFFVGDERRVFYVHLSMMMRNGLVLRVALQKLYGIYSLSGRNTRIWNAKAAVTKECLDGLDQASTVPDTLYDWIPYDEHQLIDAGTKGGGGIELALKRAAELVERKGKMRSTIIAKMSYPLVQLIGVIFLLYYVAVNAMPQILRMSKPENWDFSAHVMAGLSFSVQHYGVLILTGMILMVLFMIWSLPNLTGTLRMWLEPIPPWSICARVWGATFLYNYALLQAQGRMGVEILLDGIETSNPYMSERMHGALVGVKNGKNIGEALHLAAFNFPSREAVEFTRAIAGQDGGHESLMQFTSEWMDQTVKDVSALSDFFSMLVMMFNFGVLFAVLSGASSMGMSAIGQAGT
jgi:type II secretory pathway component PulF